jgi:hypothetical protein
MLKFKLESIHIDEIEKITLYNCDNSTRVFSENIKIIVHGFINYKEKKDNESYTDIIKTCIDGFFILPTKEYNTLSNKKTYNHSLQCLYKKLYIQNDELFFSGVNERIIKNINISEIEVISYRVNSVEQDKFLMVNIRGKMTIEIGESKNTLVLETGYKILRTELKNIDKTNKEQLIKYIKQNYVKEIK